MTDDYLKNQAVHQNQAGSVRQQSLEERLSTGSSGGLEVDALRSLSCPDDETATKTYDTTSNDVCFERDTRHTESRHLGRESDIIERAVRPAPGSSCTLPEVEAVETDGPEPVTSSPRSPVAILSQSSAIDVEQDGPEPVTLSAPLSHPVAILSQSSANDVEQDAAIPSLMRTSSGATASAHRRPPLNHSSSVTLRNYQRELAEPGCQGSNCIICAPTGSGKTFTAGSICKTRRDDAVGRQRRFKCLFVVCIRNLISQQRDALCRIMSESGVICGMDDKLMLSEYFQYYDVVVATAQVCLSEEL